MNRKTFLDEKRFSQMRVQRRNQRRNEQEQSQRAEPADTVERPYPHRCPEGDMLEKLNQHKACPDQHQVQPQQPQPSTGMTYSTAGAEFEEILNDGDVPF